MGKVVGLVLVISCSWVVPGCTYRAWYEGFKERQRQDCYKNPSQDEIRKCLDAVDARSYEEYVKGSKGSEGASR